RHAASLKLEQRALEFNGRRQNSRIRIENDNRFDAGWHFREKGLECARLLLIGYPTDRMHAHRLQTFPRTISGSVIDDPEMPPVAVEMADKRLEVVCGVVHRRDDGIRPEMEA